MDVREFEEIFRQNYSQGNSLGSIVLTPFYSSSSLYGVPEFSRPTVRYIPLSSFQKIFISTKKVSPQPGFWRFSAVGKRMLEILEIFIRAGYALSGFRLSGEGGSDAKVSGFPSLSKVALEESNHSSRLNIDEVTLNRKGSELRFDNSLSITVSGDYPDIGVIFQAFRLHESLASSIYALFERTSVRKGLLNHGTKADQCPNGEEWHSVEWVPGKNISTSVYDNYGFRTVHVEERESPGNWIRMSGDSMIRSIVRGPLCSFDFFALYMQILGDA